MTPRRIICADAMEWLAAECPPCSIVTSPPLAQELGQGMDHWERWYREALRLAFARLAPGAPAVLYQTDQKHQGRLVSSFGHILAAAQEAGLRLLWHKVVMRREPGKVDIHRPGFSHLAAFGDEKCRPGAATPDIIQRGASLYQNGMGMVPARLAVEFAGRPGLPLVDPFCGRGTVPAVAAALGFEAIGVDIDEGQCAAARRVQLRLRQP